MHVKLTLAPLLAVIAASPALAADRRPPLEVQGHRGCRALRPENTLAAFREALRLGVDVLEMDLQITRDGVLVVSHNHALPPELCLNAEGKRLEKEVPISSLSLAELKTYDCGSLRNPRFPQQVPSPGERVPTLVEVFELVKTSAEPAAARVRMNIETKITPISTDYTPERFVELLAALVRKYHYDDRVILQSFDDRTLPLMKKTLPRVKLAMLISENHLPLVPVARALNVDIISPDHGWILAADVEALHQAGVQVIPWTANDPEHWQRLIDMGVDGIITDDPAALIAYLKERGLR